MHVYVYVPLLHGAQIFKMLRNKKSHFSRARQSITGTAGKKPSDPENLAAGSTSAGINSNARSLAIVNAVMANGGALNGVRLLSEEACAASMAKVKIENDAFFGMKTGLSQVHEPWRAPRTCCLARLFKLHSSPTHAVSL